MIFISVPGLKMLYDSDMKKGVTRHGSGYIDRGDATIQQDTGTLIWRVAKSGQRSRVSVHGGITKVELAVRPSLNFNVTSLSRTNSQVYDPHYTVQDIRMMSESPADQSHSALPNLHNPMPTGSSAKVPLQSVYGSQEVVAGSGSKGTQTQGGGAAAGENSTEDGGSFRKSRTSQGSHGNVVLIATSKVKHREEVMMRRSSAFERKAGQGPAKRAKSIITKHRETIHHQLVERSVRDLGENPLENPVEKRSV